MPDGIDHVSVYPPDAQQLLAILDAAAIWSSGTLVSRPAAGLAGRFYLATDVADGGPRGTVYLDTGSAWILQNQVAFSSGVIASRPAAGTFGRLYYATDTSTLWFDISTSWKTMSGGADVLLPAPTQSVSGSVVPDMSTGLVFPLTLTGNATIQNPTNLPQRCDELVFILTQNGTGGWAPTWGNQFVVVPVVCGVPGSVTVARFVNAGTLVSPSWTSINNLGAVGATLTAGANVTNTSAAVSVFQGGLAVLNGVLTLNGSLSAGAVIATIGTGAIPASTKFVTGIDSIDADSTIAAQIAPGTGQMSLIGFGPVSGPYYFATAYNLH